MLIAVGTLAVLGALYVLLPALAGLERTWSRVSTGDPWWLAVAAGLEVLSFASYVVLFRAVFGGAGARIGWLQSYRITMAGVVATRLFAAGGAGGVILTVWALDKRGLAAREIAARTATLLVLLYGFYMAALVLLGSGLRIGWFGEPAPFGLTVVPALFGATVIVVALAVALYSRSLGSALERFQDALGTAARWARALATVPATLRAGVRGALRLVLSREPGALGLIGWWGFDIAVLYTCLRAFRGDPAISIVVMAYFVGMAANTLPVPGGVGAVDGGMIGALIGFGVDGGLAIVGVLSYRFFAFWLPMIPGVIAYVQLVRAEPERAASPRGA